MIQELKQTFYRFHPVTGADANDFDTTEWSDKQKAGLAEMIRGGAQFYWERSNEPVEKTLQGYTRVERANVTFVLQVTGVPFEFVETHDSH